jgi:hypothetical protein
MAAFRNDTIMKEWELSFGLEGQPGEMLQILRISHLSAWKMGIGK